MVCRSPCEYASFGTVCACGASNWENTEPRPARPKARASTGPVSRGSEAGKAPTAAPALPRAAPASVTPPWALPVEDVEVGGPGEQFPIAPGRTERPPSHGRATAFAGDDAAAPRARSMPADDGEDLRWLGDTERRLRAAFRQLRIESEPVGPAVLTPNAARITLRGTARCTCEQVARKKSELLTTHGLHVHALEPGPGTITLAIERPHRRVIHLRDLWADWQRQPHGPTDLLIGLREADGRPLVLSPGGDRHAPHTLIAGATGSGKSILLQAILLGIAVGNTPAEAQITVIDPKQGVDFCGLEDLPHIDGGVVSDRREALDRMVALVDEMDARFVRFRAARVPNLAAYNARVDAAGRLPRLWLVHDEFADWMLDDEYHGEVASLVGRLGVRARAAGIHLVFAAQRPDANVMPLQLRDNLGNRLALKVNSEGTSEIVIGERGAESLLGRGHLIARLDGEPLQYAQVPLVDPDFLEEAVGQAIRRSGCFGASSRARAEGATDWSPESGAQSPECGIQTPDSGDQNPVELVGPWN